MKIVVIGGTSLIGKQVVANLSKSGHDVVPASPSLGINSKTGKGIAKTLKGADVLIDTTNATSFMPDEVMDFFVSSTINLIQSAKSASIIHYIVLSVTGTERDDANAYYIAKRVQENLVVYSGIPFSIVHATQLFEFIPGITESGLVGDEFYLPPAHFQPVASAEVAELLSEIAGGVPVNRIISIVGPEKLCIDDSARKYLSFKKDKRKVITDNNANYFETKATTKPHVPAGVVIIGNMNYEEWLGEQGA